MGALDELRREMATLERDLGRVIHAIDHASGHPSLVAWKRLIEAESRQLAARLEGMRLDDLDAGDRAWQAVSS